MHQSESAEEAARSYERRAGSVAIAAGIGGIVYSVAFLGGVVAGWAPDLGKLVSAVALLVVYLGRLIVLDPTNPLVAAPAALTGLILSPAFYIWLGLELRRGG